MERSSFLKRVAALVGSAIVTPAIAAPLESIVPGEEPVPEVDEKADWPPAAGDVMQTDDGNLYHVTAVIHEEKGKYKFEACAMTGRASARKYYLCEMWDKSKHKIITAA